LAISALIVACVAAAASELGGVSGSKVSGGSKRSVAAVPGVVVTSTT
jgi:outer membrane lipoprotein SlyB